MANRECILKIKEIRDILINTGYNVFEINDGNILVKTPKNGRLVSKGITSYNTMVCTTNPMGTINNGNCTCKHQCMESGTVNCPIHGTNIGNNNTGSNTNTGTTTLINTSALFRVRVNDIESGINVHAILLDGHTDLKVSYKLEDTKLASKVVNLINFLVV